MPNLHKIIHTILTLPIYSVIVNLFNEVTAKYSFPA